jgi:secreted PhoX family phosphatase
MDNITKFEEITNSLISRRSLIKKGFAFGGLALMSSTLGSITAYSSQSFFNFTKVDCNNNDTVTLPEQYNWSVVSKWGDPMWSDVEEFNQTSCGSHESQLKSVGDNNDGMELFITSDNKTLLAVNNEYTNHKIIFSNRKSLLPENKEDILKGMYAHGVSIFEIKNSNNQWNLVKDSKYNRRITPFTKMEITGPAKGHSLMKTKEDKDGIYAKGTWNNCGSGKTPWGTYLTCEENFNKYFSSSDKNFKSTNELNRYGIRTREIGLNWAKADSRFDLSKEVNEPNKVGYVVEIDPLNPNSTPKKHTALGRFKHENAELVISKDGKIVVYMGDDERGEYLYKYVSNESMNEVKDKGTLLSDGNLYVAKFNDNFTGEWLLLDTQTTGLSSKAEVCIFTRLAASKVGATTMDRPEWIASNPKKNEVCCCLTNNKNRGIKTNKGGDKVDVDKVNPRKNNKYGQIVRWKPRDNNHSSVYFEWDLFVVAGNPNVHDDNNRGSKNIDKENMFNSPDGLKFDKYGRLWIQTDGNYSNSGDFKGMGNNQMLIADTNTGKIKRFMVGPKECEVTGLTFAPDYKTVFVGIQHPGERLGSNFPDNGNNKPRSCIIAIQKKDGSEILT